MSSQCSLGAVIALVDARNVLRSRWPNVPEEELVERCEAWARDEGHRAIVVFDGKAPGGLVGEQERSAACVLVGTGGESADDWIVRRAVELAEQERPYWLVTSDRELRDRAGEATRHIVGGGMFLSLLGLSRPRARGS
jgi:predicted RNA-binding protein with PIN domain